MVSVVVVGAGVFGLTSALALAGRGHAVTVVDGGPVPHPLAASTDLSKLVRDDYGGDDHHTDLMVEAYAGWDRWNARWDRPLFHRTGMLLLASGTMAPGGFEHDGHLAHLARGHAPTRVDRDLLAAEHPRWAAEGRFVDGYRNDRAGWVESGEVVARLVGDLAPAGIGLRTGSRVAGLRERAGRVVGVATEDGGEVSADVVVLAVGAWTGALLPELRGFVRATGQPVLHLAPPDPGSWTAPAFPAWCADIATTGLYGMPLHRSGVVKVGRHATGVPLAPTDDERVLSPQLVAELLTQLAQVLPALAAAPLVATRLCAYTDTADGDFLIDHHPDRPGLVVATGGSGHAFKFAPVLGDVVADVVEGVDNRWAHRWAWRDGDAAWREAARATA